MNEYYIWKRDPLSTKHTTRKPDNKEEKLKNINPANPKATEISDWTQNALLAVHVSLSFNVRANAVPAESADNNMYAKTWSWLKSNQTCTISGRTVVPLDISQTEAPISNSEYNATIPAAIATNLNASKWYHRRESESESEPPPWELANMKIAEASEKQKAANRKMSIKMLNRRFFWTETVEWNWDWFLDRGDGVLIPPFRFGSCGDLNIFSGEKFRRRWRNS